MSKAVFWVTHFTHGLACENFYVVQHYLRISRTTPLRRFLPSTYILINWIASLLILAILIF